MLTAAAFATEFAYAAEASYGIPAMLKAGLTAKYASAMWAVGPILGLLFQGYLGAASDRCTCSWGRRRPFILGIAIGVCITLALFPYGRLLSEYLALEEGMARFCVMVFTAVVFVAMDFSLDALQSPVRAYLLDSIPAERSEKANFLYSGMLGLGACFGSLISAIPWEKFGFAESADLTNQVKVVFRISLVVMMVCVYLTLNSVGERAHSPKHESDTGREATSLGDSCCLTLTEKESQINPRSQSPSPPAKNGSPTNMEYDDPASSVQLKCSCHQDLYESLYGTFLFAKYMSKTFFNLWLLVFFSWVAFLPLFLFYTDFVGSVVYKGSATSEDKELRALYDKGVRMGCWCATATDALTFFCSLLSGHISERIGLKLPLMVGHALYWAACGVTVLYPSVITVWLLSAVSGLYFTNLVSIPYALTSYYIVSLL